MTRVPPPEDILQSVLVEEDQLQARIRNLAEEISRDYAGKEDILLVCILKGGVMFLVDLMKHLTIPHAVDFMDIASYGVGVRESSGDVRVLMDLHQPIEGKHLLLVEDIVDSGNTISHVVRLLNAREPASLRIVTLLDKSERREVDLHLDYVGFEIPDAFVFGYGLDIDEYYRDLPYIGIVKPGTLISK